MLKVNMISESVFTVQGHGVHTAFLQMTRALKARQNFDVVVNKFRPKAQITHIHTFGFYGLLHLLFGPGKKVVSVHVVPDSLVGSIAGAEYFYGFSRWYLKFFYSRADLLLAVSKTVENTLQNDLQIKKPIKVLYNTVDMGIYEISDKDRLLSRKLLKVEPKAQVVVSCGQIQPRKRFDVFCTLACRMPDVTFVWVGGIPFKRLGAEYLVMQNLVDCKPDNVLVTGVLEPDEVKNYIQSADVFFLPSDQENHPMAVLEAAGAGLPIVVRDLAEYDDTFKHDAVRGSDDDFQALIAQLLANGEARQKAVKGAKQIAKRFDSKTGSEKLAKLYQELL